jgi:hypothetical protein
MEERKTALVRATGRMQDEAAGILRVRHGIKTIVLMAPADGMARLHGGGRFACPCPPAILPWRLELGLQPLSVLDGIGCQAAADEIEAAGFRREKEK